MAQTGSISVQSTTHPIPRNAAQHPFPTSPYPHTKTIFPANMQSVKRYKINWHGMNNIQKLKGGY